MNTVTINRVSFSAVGSISIKGNKVILDGKDITPDAKEISITVHGNVDLISADNIETLIVTGNAGSVKTMSGDVEVNGNVSGSISTMSGSVACGCVLGSVSSMTGSIGKGQLK